MAPLPARFLQLFLWGAIALSSSAAAQTAEPGASLARALDEARTGDWTAASATAGETGNRVVEDIVLWLRLRDGGGTWPEYADFLARNGNWPGLALVRTRAEQAMPAGLPAEAVIAFFATEAPRTGAGALRHADALMTSGRNDDAEAEILRAWRELSMTGSEQNAILARYEAALAPHHVARLDNMLWRGLTAEAQNMLPLVGADWQALGRARIGLRRDVDGTTALINAVPQALQSDPGMAYERYLWRVRKGRWDDAEAFMLQHSTSAEALGRPDLWMERRANLARQALRRGDADTAYRIAAQNFGSAGSAYADSEWMAGYIALTRRDDPETAVAHFRRFQSAVFTPISLGRAGYWLGLALEEAGAAEEAQEAFRFAAQHQTSFYGLLAAERAGIDADPRIAGDAGTPDWREQPFMNSTVVQAARLLLLAEDDARAMQFFRHAAETLPAGPRAALAQMAIDLGRPHIGVRMAKDAAAAGMILPNQYYPVHDLAQGDWPVPTELAMAIARQESEFNHRAVSPAGAKGLMQLMPRTAEQVARIIGTDYDERSLTADPEYNARLGTAYLRQMLDRYRGSLILTAAAYNAGPGRVDQWLQTYGDPRGPAVDAITWIESIPFEETRNYVMRVLEGLHVYRARLNGQAEPIRLVSDINRTG
jgi:soluble lytic murein transglycosylase